MKKEQEVLHKMDEIKEKINLLEKKLNEELQKGLFKRDYRLLNFLRNEHNILEMTYSHLLWIINDNEVV